MSVPRSIFRAEALAGRVRRETPTEPPRGFSTRALWIAWATVLGFLVLGWVVWSMPVDVYVEGTGFVAEWRGGPPLERGTHALVAVFPDGTALVPGHVIRLRSDPARALELVLVESRTHSSAGIEERFAIDASRWPRLRDGGCVAVVKLAPGDPLLRTADTAFPVEAQVGARSARSLVSLGAEKPR